MRTTPGDFVLAAALVIVYAGVIVVPLVSIARKMGYSGLVALPAVIPGVNIILAWYLALREWPIQREIRMLRSAVQRSE